MNQITNTRKTVCIMANELKRSGYSPSEAFRTAWRRVKASMTIRSGTTFDNRQERLGLYKTALPFISGVTTIPLVYVATFALGTGAKVLIEAKKNDQSIADEYLKKIVEKAKNVADGQLRHEVAMLLFDGEVLESLKKAYFNW